MRSITILGAGLVGSLLAVMMRRRGYPVTVYERRPDMRREKVQAGRSINLAMSTRGWKALDIAGLREAIEPIAIPMKGRFLHQPDGSTAFQPYGKNGEAIYSVSRGELNKKLMSLAEEEGAVIEFNKRCSQVDVANNVLYLEDVEPGTAAASSNTQSANRNQRSGIPADLLFGADGAFSALRTSYSYRDRVSSRQDYIDYGYKELNIPPGPASSLWLMEKEALHIWPRGAFMLIALPNIDGSFTCTLFAPFEGSKSFAALNDAAAVREFFEENFADIIPIMPDYAAQMERNPVASLITTHISSWHYGDKSALIGDAAHAIVPFYGQGMNAGFEDCSVLWELLNQHGDDDWAHVLPEYQRLRRPAGDAVGELALQNFIEMRDKVADPRFLERKKWEKELGLRYPGKFNSVYEMVSFSHTPYHTALQCTRAQDVLLERILNVGDPAPYLDVWVEEYHQGVKDLDFGAVAAQTSV